MIVLTLEFTYDSFWQRIEPTRFFHPAVPANHHFLDVCAPGKVADLQNSRSEHTLHAAA
jgi:hypothetical protein